MTWPNLTTIRSGIRPCITGGTMSVARKAAKSIKDLVCKRPICVAPSAILVTHHQDVAIILVNLLTAMGMIWNARMGQFEPYEPGFGPLEPLPSYPPGTMAGFPQLDPPAREELGGRSLGNLENVPLAHLRSNASAGLPTGRHEAPPQARNAVSLASHSGAALQLPGLAGAIQRAATPYPTVPVLLPGTQQIRADLFTISFQVYFEIKGRHRKNVWKDVKEPNIHIPAQFFDQPHSLMSFKKAIAGLCVHAGLPMKRAILFWEGQGHLKWRGHVNGTSQFSRSGNVVLADDTVYERFISVCARSSKTMGVRVSMDNPSVKAIELQTESAVRSSLRRMNKEHAPSSDGSGTTVLGLEDASDSDQTLQDGEAQKLANACIEIRKTLLGTDLTSGESPYCAHPEKPRHRIRITNPLLRLWAQDLVDKVPGISTTVPPMARPEFRGKGNHKRTCEEVEEEDESCGHGHDGHRAKNYDEGNLADALAVEVPLGDYIHFANVRNDDKVEVLCQALGSLGIDHWSVFLSNDCLEPLKEAGIDFGTRQKLVIAARRFELKLIKDARNSRE